MKKLMFAAVAAALVGLAKADVDMNLVEKELQTITIPFGIRSYTPSNKDVVRIEKVSDTTLRITALKSGRCDIEVRGDMEMTEKYHISVGGPLPQLLGFLQRDLEKIPEVAAEINGNVIKVTGTIKSIKKWNYLAKVLNSKQYSGSVENYVEFDIPDELKLKMKASLEQCGFSVTMSEPFTGDWKTWKGNAVALSCNRENRTMLVQAKVYTPEQAKMIEECFKREKFWLKVDAADAKSFDDEKQYYVNFQVHVAKPQIRLSVAYMAIDEADIKKIGNANAVLNENGGFSLSGAVQGLLDAISMRDPDGIATTGRAGTYSGTRSGLAGSIFGNLGFNTRFFKQNGISRISDTGYTVLESWAEGGAKFKSGGTLYVKVPGKDVAELKEIPYGFTVNALGGMVDETAMSCDFDFGLSSVIPSVTGEYDRKEDLSKQKLTLPIGRTTLIGGFKKLLDDNMPPSGLPVLRNTPILNWFVADSGKEVSDRRLVIMVCPEIVDNTQDGNLNVEKEINIRVPEQAKRPTDEVLEERKPFTGFWSWLNWFTF